MEIYLHKWSHNNYADGHDRQAWRLRTGDDVNWFRQDNDYLFMQVQAYLFILVKLKLTTLLRWIDLAL